MNLTNQFLIATAQLAGSVFERTVILICQHDQEGAMGILVNQPTEAKLAEIFSQLDINDSASWHKKNNVFAGGPVSQENGFVLHTPVGNWHNSIAISDNIAITSSKDVLEALGNNTGPDKCLFALGYTGWSKGQLEAEIGKNDWITAKASEDIIFDVDTNERWQQAVKLTGITNISQLSSIAGNA